MRIISSLVIVFLCFFTLVWVYLCLRVIVRSVLKKEEFSFGSLVMLEDVIRKKPIGSSLFLLVVLAVFLYNNSAFNELVGIHRPLSERPSGVYSYYVNAIEVETGKQYTVPAQIEVEYWRDEDGIDVDYCITSLVFDDGSVVSFEDMTRSYFDCYSLCNDEDGNEWKCQLTELHAFCRQIQETSSIKTTSIIELCAITVAILYNWIGGIVLLTKPKK